MSVARSFLSEISSHKVALHLSLKTNRLENSVLSFYFYSYAVFFYQMQFTFF